MTLFLILAPYGAYTALMLLVPAAASLLAAAVISAAIIAIDVIHGRAIKLLNAGTIVWFSGVAGYLAFVDPTISTAAVKFIVDGGMFLISVGSILIRRPFTLQYAIEAVPAETASIPGFLRANYIITAAWAAATLLMMVGNAVVLYVPWLPFWTGLAVAFAARNCAVYFTRWYPQYQRLKHAGRTAAMVPAAK